MSIERGEMDGYSFRKKKKKIDLKDIRKDRYAKNEFVARMSPLDEIVEYSSIKQSPFRGILRLSLYILALYVVSNKMVRFI
jgi:hypothetical protein